MAAELFWEADAGANEDFRGDGFIRGDLKALGFGFSRRGEALGRPEAVGRENAAGLGVSGVGGTFWTFRRAGRLGVLSVKDDAVWKSARLGGGADETADSSESSSPSSSVSHLLRSACAFARASADGAMIPFDAVWNPVVNVVAAWKLIEASGASASNQES